MLDAQQIATREALADAEFEQYQFGDDVTVSESDNWDKSDAADFTKVVYITCDGDAPDTDSERVSFHVRFNADGSVDDAYGLLMRNGSDIGCRPADQAEMKTTVEIDAVEIVRKELPITLTDTNGKSKRFLLKIVGDGLVTEPISSDRGFGASHTDSAEIDGFTVSGDVWRFFDGTLGLQALYEILAAKKRNAGEFLARFNERFEKTSDDETALVQWNEMVSVDEAQDGSEDAQALAAPQN